MIHGTWILNEEKKSLETVSSFVVGELYEFVLKLTSLTYKMTL